MHACLASSHPWHMPMIGRVNGSRLTFTRMHCTVFVERVMCYDCHPEGCLVNSLPVTHSSPCVSTGKNMNVVMSKECLYTVRMYCIYIVHLHESVVFSCLTEKTCWDLLLPYDFVLACGGT